MPIAHFEPGEMFASVAGYAIALFGLWIGGRFTAINLQIGNKAVFEILVNNCSPVSSHGGNRGNCQPNLRIHIMGEHAACPRQEGRDETQCSRGAGAERDRERHFLTRQGEWCGQPLNWVC